MLFTMAYKKADANKNFRTNHLESKLQVKHSPQSFGYRALCYTYLTHKTQM